MDPPIRYQRTEGPIRDFTSLLNLHLVAMSLSKYPLSVVLPRLLEHCAKRSDDVIDLIQCLQLQNPGSEVELLFQLAPSITDPMFSEDWCSEEFCRLLWSSCSDKTHALLYIKSLVKRSRSIRSSTFAWFSWKFLFAGLHNEVVEVAEEMMKGDNELNQSFFHNVQLARAYLRCGELASSLQTWYKIANGVESGDPKEKQMVEDALYAFACELGQVVSLYGKPLLFNCVFQEGSSIDALVDHGLSIAVADPDRTIKSLDGMTVVTSNNYRVSWRRASTWLPFLARFNQGSKERLEKLCRSQIEADISTKTEVSLSLYPHLRRRQLYASISLRLELYDEAFQISMPFGHVRALQNLALQMWQVQDNEVMFRDLGFGQRIHDALPILKISRDTIYLTNGLDASNAHWDKLIQAYAHPKLSNHDSTHCACSQCFALLMEAEGVQWMVDRGEYDYAASNCLQLLNHVLELLRQSWRFNRCMEMIPKQLVRNLYCIYHNQCDFISMIVIHTTLYGRKADPSGFHPFLRLGLSTMALEYASEGLPSRFSRSVNLDN